MSDITLSLDDTLELDEIIQEWSRTDSNLNLNGDESSFDISGLQTKTSILNPQEPGEYTITINGQDLSVEVTDPSTIPNNPIYNYESGSITGWQNDNSKSLSAVTTTNDGTDSPEGAYCGEAYHSGSNSVNHYDFGPISPSGFRIYMRTEGLTNTGNSFLIRLFEGGNRSKYVLTVRLDPPNNTTYINRTDSGESPNDSQWYEIIFQNIDWSNNTVGSVLIDRNEVMSDVSFINDASELDNVELYGSESGLNFYTYSDFIAYSN